MTIISVGGTKGGCGKSTTTINIAAEFSRRGFSVGILDADKKASSSNWVKCRNEFIYFLNNQVFKEDSEYIDLEVVKECFTSSQLKRLRAQEIKTIEGKHSIGDIRDTIIAMSERNDIVIVDVGGGDTREFRQANGMADILITPFKPSTFDTDTIPELVDALDLAVGARPDLVIRSLVNEMPSGGMKQRGAKLVALLKEYPVLSKNFVTKIKSRTAYVDSLDCGLGVVDFFDGPAKGEISNVVEELLKDINV